MSRAARRPFLALTAGDPAGVGPRVGVEAALDRAVRRRCRPVLVGDAWIIQKSFRRRSGGVRVMTDLSQFIDAPGVLNVLHVPHPLISTVVPGRPQRVSGESACLAVRAAVRLALSGRAAAVMTGPISKESMGLARVPFPGHTEMLAAMSGVPANSVEMLMTAGDLRAVLLTRHIPLRRVADKINSRLIVDGVTRADQWLKKRLRLGRKIRWALCGLNPHAGDGGLIGREEIKHATPAAARLVKNGLSVTGPLPADVAWARHKKGEFDAVACLYHDQGMIPLKTAYPNRVVNVTTGLPFVRTSPGHGTAFDLARGRAPFDAADATATKEASHLALDLAGVGKG